MKKNTQNLQALPSDEDIRLARASAEELMQLMVKISKADRAQIRMDDQDLILPRYALVLLQKVLAEMAKGNVVSIVPTHHLLTTQEAANILNVSRPYLIGLLESGKISYSKVGTHRRIKYQDLMEYKQAQDESSQKLLNELTQLAEESDMGY